jgi:hypothetical protein
MQIITLLARRDGRCVICGIACAGPLLCVNTQQPKHLIGHCKSSINTGFQQLGSEVVRNRTKMRNSISAVIPDLRIDPAAVRPWTVRAATDAYRLCFCSTFAAVALPVIVADDFIDERHSVKAVAAPPAALPSPPIRHVTFEPMRAAQRRPLPRFDFGPCEGNDYEVPFPDIAATFSVDSLSSLDSAAERDYDPLGSFFEPRSSWLGRSQSVDLGHPFQ